MTNNDLPFVDITNGGFSFGQLTLVLHNLGGSAALIHRLEAGGEQIGLPRFSLAAGDVVEKKVDVSSKKITRELIEPPQLRLAYKSLSGQELTTVADVEQTSRAGGRFNVGKIEGSAPADGRQEAMSEKQVGGTFSVALSYAGEDRKYAKAVYDTLRSQGISAFYDRDADIEIEMWGHNLPGYLQEIFGKGRADYCVIFVSDAYQQKAFTIYELENAVAHGLLSRKKDYILPVMLQGDELPAPLTATVKYMDARDQKVSPEELARMIAVKVGGRHIKNDSDNGSSSASSVRRPRIPSTKPDPNSDPDNVLKYLVTELGKRGETLKENGIDVAFVQRGEQHIVQVKRGNQKIYNVAVWLGGMTGDDELCFFQWTDQRMSGTNSMHAFGRVEWSQEKNAYVINLTNVSLLKEIGGQYALTPPELVELLWENIVQAIEDEYARQ